MIKKSIFTLVFMAVIGWVSAQSLQFEMDGRVFANNEVYICEDAPTSWGEIELKMQLRNLTDRQIDVVVEKEYVKIVDGTSNTFCWGSCLGPEAFTTRPKTMEPNAVSVDGDLSFHYQVDPNYSDDETSYIVGTSVIKYYAYLAVSSFSLLHHVSYIRQQRNLAGALHGLSHAALILQRSTGDATGQNLTLLVQELLQELGIFVVDILDTALLETAILLLLRIDRRSSQITNFTLFCHSLSLL